MVTGGSDENDSGVDGLAGGVVQVSGLPPAMVALTDGVAAAEGAALAEVEAEGTAEADAVGVEPARDAGAALLAAPEDADQHDGHDDHDHRAPP